MSSINIVGSRLTGWEEAACIGLPLEDVLKIADNDGNGTNHNALYSAIGESRTVTLAGETVLTARDGAEIYVDCRAAPITDAFGNRMGSVIVFRNVTVRRQQEQELRESDRRKGEFLAVMSHELRNPAAAIQAALDLLNRAAGQEYEQRRLYALMTRQMSQIVRIIDDFLDVVRVSKGKLELKKGIVDLRAMMDIVRIPVIVTAHSG